MRTHALAIALLAIVGLQAEARADAGWFEVGDTQLRIDLQLLNDADVISYPSNQRPTARAMRSS